MEKWKETCAEMEEFEAEMFAIFGCDVDKLTKAKIEGSKAKKELLAGWVFQFAEMYQSMKGFTMSAASKIDDLNCRVIQGQEKIINLQEELISNKDQQLASVRTEIRRSWSEVVATNSRQAVTTAAKIKEAVKSAVAEEDQSRNFMIFGKGEVLNEDVSETVAELLQDMNVKPRVVECMRVGTAETGKSRPIKVKLTSIDAVSGILRNARNLKNSVSNRATFIGPDRSTEERAEHNKLVEKMKARMRDEPGKYHYIRRGVIISVKRQVISRD